MGKMRRGKCERKMESNNEEKRRKRSMKKRRNTNKIMEREEMEERRRQECETGNRDTGKRAGEKKSRIK